MRDAPTDAPTDTLAALTPAAPLQRPQAPGSSPRTANETLYGGRLRAIVLLLGEHREHRCHLPLCLPSCSPTTARPRGLADITLQNPRSLAKKSKMSYLGLVQKREQVSLATLGTAQELQPLGQGSQIPPGPLERSAHFSPS